MVTKQSTKIAKLVHHKTKAMYGIYQLCMYLSNNIGMYALFFKQQNTNSMIIIIVVNIIMAMIPIMMPTTAVLESGISSSSELIT